MSEEKKKYEGPVNKAAIKLIHADGFYPKGEAEAAWGVVHNLRFQPKNYGDEIENFSLVLPGIDEIFSKMIGEELEVDRSVSGVFRRPYNGLIHFEHFDQPNEWCFVIALEKTTLNIYNHVKDIRKNPKIDVDAETALDGYQFNYRNMFEWDVQTNIVLKPNQGVFFRPWCFHSFEDGVINYYRLLPKHRPWENKGNQESLEDNTPKE